MKVECNSTIKAAEEDRSLAAERSARGAVNGPRDAVAVPKELCHVGAFFSISAPGTPTSHSASALPPSPILSANSPPRRKASVPVIGTGAGQTHAKCLICSDRATGKHYGSISCDGCKGFFRRTIRKKHNYACRFSQNCVVDKNQRNSCRRCRFDKCLGNGMRPEAVQLERDRIAATRRNSKSGSANDGDASATETAGATSGRDDRATAMDCCFVNNAEDEVVPSSTFADAEKILRRLMEAEKTLKVAKATARRDSPGTTTANCRTATTGDVTDSMHQQLILLVEWAKQLEEFRRLSLRSQIALLRHFSAQHLVLCAAFRSLVRVAETDAVWLANDRCVPRDAPKIPDVNRVVARILDHLTGPMRRLRLEEREFAALKAVAFFDPMAKGVEESSVAAVEEMRHRILAAFEHQVQRVSEHRAKMPLRLANLLLLLPPLMAIARDLVEEAQLAKLFGLANVDELMAELLLPEDAETRSYSRLRTSVTSSIVQSNVTSPTPPSTSQRHQHSLILHGASPSPTALPTPNGSSSSTVQQSHQPWVGEAHTNREEAVSKAQMAND
ncbi:hypothetical protein GPALN_003590 [Globodera pallida]|nr:hypothetical protein GPALN_003590 [Globodera pallida]